MWVLQLRGPVWAQLSVPWKKACRSADPSPGHLRGRGGAGVWQAPGSPWGGGGGPSSAAAPGARPLGQGPIWVLQQSATTVATREDRRPGRRRTPLPSGGGSLAEFILERVHRVTAVGTGSGRAEGWVLSEKRPPERLLFPKAVFALRERGAWAPWRIPAHSDFCLSVLRRPDGCAWRAGRKGPGRDGGQSLRGSASAEC